MGTAHADFVSGFSFSMEICNNYQQNVLGELWFKLFFCRYLTEIANVTTPSL